MFKRFISVMISLMMVMTMTPFAMAETVKTDESSEGAASEDLAAFEALEEDDYAHGEAIVLFEEGAVRDRKMTIKSARKMDEVDSSFGELMDKSGDADEAAKDAKAEISIIKDSLGDDFVIKDSVAIDDDFVTCLVSSGKYNTETLIKKLSENGRIKAVSANTYLEPENYDYSLDDELNQYAYQTNSPADNNKAGQNVTSRGADPEKAVSTRAGAVTDFAADHSKEDEVVVAVTDSGINETHEDLKNMLWTNPGNIGLEGEHGFNFDDNAADLTDRVGHGTHCSGIIAAEANNGKGVAGVASGVNVKIMMCAISNSIQDEDGNAIETDMPTTFRRIGAMNYVLRAKERGVNVVATSNSWGSPDLSSVFDAAIDKLGEAGILSFVAASNDGADVDKVHYAPAGGDSQYMVTVGSVDVTGKPSGFTNFGKSYVDLFATGHNILSTSSFSIYEPSLYSAEERAENTEYYGGFNSTVVVGKEVDAELGTNKVIPSTEGNGVKPFKALKFFKQDKGAGEGGDESEESSETPEEGSETPEEGGDTQADGAPEATCELSISTDKFFTDSYGAGSAVKPASLKATIHNARYDEEYYLYFPFDKNHATTGADNTKYSITAILQHNDDEFNAMILGGEAVRHNKDGKIVMSINDCGEAESSSMNDNIVDNFNCGARGNAATALSSWDDSDPEKTDVVETGIGLSITPSVEIGDEAGTATVRDITIYIDSVGVSKPVTEEGKTPDDVFPADSSYEIMSGTSMATPAAAGAYAVLTTKYPKKEGQTEAEYAEEMRTRLFSIVRQTDELKELCSTGGYIDLSLIENEKSNASISDAVCDVEKDTLTLHGTGFTKDMKLSCRSLAEKDAKEKAIPYDSMKVSFAEDGKTITISNAKDLFGRYLEFILRRGDNAAARGAFFTVKGQSMLKKVLTEEHKESFSKESVTIPPRILLTDTEGKNLYAYQANTYSLYENTAGVLYKYDGTKFIEYKGTELGDAVFDFYEQELGYDRHQITRGLKVQPDVVRQPIYENNVLYDFVRTEYTPYFEAEEEKIERKTYLASLDYTAKSPKWKFREIPFIDSVYDGPGSIKMDKLAYAAMDGKIYCFGAPVNEYDRVTEDNYMTFAYALDIEKGTWERKADCREAGLNAVKAYCKDGKIWLMFGEDNNSPSKGVYSFDGEKTWKKVGVIPFVGRAGTATEPAECAAAPVKDGFILMDYSVDGAGNVSIFDTKAGKCKPLYYTLGTGLSDPPFVRGGVSVAETADGIYYINLLCDTGQLYRFDMYQIPKTDYAYTPSYKSANPWKVTKKNITLKAKMLKKKSVKKKAVKVKGAKGVVRYKRVKIKCRKKLMKAARKKIKVNTKTGKITVKKGLKKGRYLVTVKVRAKGDMIYKSAVKTVKFRVIVK